MKKKIIQATWQFLLSINTTILILAAICTVAHKPLGSFLFCWASMIGLIDSLAHKQKNGAIINSTFLAMNIYFCICYLA